ncbi:MAG: bifunctional riboflavin kinase/FAD synthetase [Tannerellaceae bacterium]
MNISRNSHPSNKKGYVATIGFFDGVHLGHRFLISQLERLAEERNLPAAIITFAEHPRAVLQADYQPKLLNSYEEKLEQLATTGVDECFVLDFTLALSHLSAQEFITMVLHEKLSVSTLLIGYDHRFGRDRADGFEQYVAYGAACGMEVVKAKPYVEGQTVVSSSEIRRLLSICRVEEAGRLLSYHYCLKGHIVSGYKVGRTIGFPTANIEVDEPFKVLPGIGVYAVWVEIEGRQQMGMLYIGRRPTLDNGENISLEVNILDFSDDIYHTEVNVSFIYYIREDKRFDNLEKLKEQLQNDRENVRQILNKTI